MLYKKYHRSYVRQFKKGILYVGLGLFRTKCNIIKEPFVSKYGIEFELVDEDSCSPLDGPPWIVDSDGKLVSYIETTYSGIKYFRLTHTGVRLFH